MGQTVICPLSLEYKYLKMYPYIYDRSTGTSSKYRWNPEYCIAKCPTTNLETGNTIELQVPYHYNDSRQPSSFLTDPNICLTMYLKNEDLDLGTSASVSQQCVVFPGRDVLALAQVEINPYIDPNTRDTEPVFKISPFSYAQGNYCQINGVTRVAYSFTVSIDSFYYENLLRYVIPSYGTDTWH